MSHIRKVALVLVLSMVAVGSGWQPSPSAAALAPAQPASGIVLVEGWCNDVCNARCEGSCAQAQTVGCTCYWICENQESGQQTCTGTVGVRVCG